MVDSAVDSKSSVSERVAIAKAIEERLAARHGSNQYQPKSVEDSDICRTPLEGRSANLAAERAGFGSGKTYERAKQAASLCWGHIWGHIRKSIFLSLIKSAR
ncbi:hypothetical protein [Thiomonas sp. X19]|uniref:hypothetical protein n=1 Tax=Thiomonas sp. X19 TaxID=1050370 RepID=UPI001E521820|nr:hypothetical protein [Thiomonas sp. X19]